MMLPVLDLRPDYSWEDFGNHLEDAWNQVAQIGAGVLVAVIVFLIARFIAKLIMRFVWGRISLVDVTPATEALVNNTVSIVVYFFAITVVLGILGASWSAVLTAISVSTLAVVFGLQDLLKSILGGAFLVIERPYEIGDRIQIRDHIGDVAEINVRTTIMRTDEGAYLMIPNSLHLSEPFVNLDRPIAAASVLTVVGIEGETAVIRKQVEEALAADPQITGTIQVIGRQDGSWWRSAWRSSEAMIPGISRDIVASNSSIQVRVLLDETEKPRDTERDAIARMKGLFPDAEVAVRRGSRLDT